MNEMKKQQEKKLNSDHVGSNEINECDGDAQAAEV
jgi:hypothetical protein